MNNLAGYRYSKITWKSGNILGRIPDRIPGRIKGNNSPRVEKRWKKCIFSDSLELADEKDGTDEEKTDGDAPLKKN